MMKFVNRKCQLADRLLHATAQGVLTATLLGAPSAAALDYPDWVHFVAGVSPQTIAFTNHGTLTVSNVTGMDTGYPKYYFYSGLTGMPAPFTTTMPALYPRGTGTFTWTFVFSQPLSGADCVIVADVDNGETCTLSAYDATGQTVDVTGWELTTLDPFPPDDGYRGKIERDGNSIHFTGPTFDTSEEMAIFRVSAGQSVARLDYNYFKGNLGGGPTIAIASAGCNCCPPLSVRLQGNQVWLTWPNSGSNCVLQTTTNLAAPAWTNVSAAPTTGSNELQVSVSADQPARFYRLIK